MTDKGSNTIEVYLDDESEPIAMYRPPGRFTLDTTLLEDGPHKLSIIAYDSTGRRGVRRIPFEVRNGPGIAVEGLSDNDVLEGKISLLVNAYGGSYEEKWEPERAETPAPIPTWIWVLFIIVAAWSIYYVARQWQPTAEFADTPTYARLDLRQPGVPGTTDAEPPGQDMGASLYRTSCASCHQVNGEGVAGVFPPLTGDSVVNSEDASRHIEVVLFGAQGSTIDGVKYVTPMPAWGEQLSDEEVAAVINHERASWGNTGTLVTASDVADVRNEKR